MGFLAAAAPAIGGLLGSAFGKSGRQGGQQQQQTGQSTGSTTGTVSGTGKNVLTQTEDPLLGPLREGITGAFTDELQRVQKPIYGEGQQAGFLNQLNDLTDLAQKGITNRFAATGGARSGTAEDQVTQTELARGGQAAQFFGQLPFLEEQARRQSTAGLLGQGLNFVGRGVTNQESTTEQNQTSQQDTQQQTQQQGTTDTEGPGFLKSLLGEAGGFLGGLLGQNPTDPFSIFKKKQASPDTVNTSEIPLSSNNRGGALDLLKQYGSTPFVGR